MKTKQKERSKGGIEKTAEKVKNENTGEARSFP